MSKKNKDNNLESADKEERLAYSKGHPYSQELLTRTIKVTDRLTWAGLATVVITLLYTAYISEKAFGDYGKDRYFAVDDIGAVKEIMQMDKAMFSKERIEEVSNEYVRSIIDIAWSNSHLELQEDKKNFTNRGFDNYLAQLAQSEWVLRLVANKENIKSEYLKKMHITGSAINNGILYHSLEGKLRAYFEGRKSRFNDVIVKIIVRNVPYDVNKKGIAIDQFYLTEIRDTPDVDKAVREELEQMKSQ